jgi:hypothetical protein
MPIRHHRERRSSMLLLLSMLAASSWAAREAWGAEVFLRFRITRPAAERFNVGVRGHRHEGPVWFIPEKTYSAPGGAWSDWIDLRDWPLHGRLNRTGGLAEWPTLRIAVHPETPAGTAGCALDVQLADGPAEDRVVISFSETSESDTICFLVPHPLRDHASEFETGSQMTARHAAWAREASGAARHDLRRFDVCTSFSTHYDPGLARQSLDALKRLGFNVVNGAEPDVLREAGVRVLGKTWTLKTDPADADREWKEYAEGELARDLATPDGRWKHASMAHFVISDEVMCLGFGDLKREKVNGWFRDYLRGIGVSEASLGIPIDEVQLPVDQLWAKTLLRDADLKTRRVQYYGGRFAQYWSARQIRHTSDLIRGALPGMKTEILPTSHGFFNAWGPPAMGLSYRLLDFYQLAEQESVDVLSAEDWLGLNHMYGPDTTWTGAQSFEYLAAVMRSAIGERPIKLLALITPGDENYLRLKAFSSLAQGCRAIYFWNFGPTYFSTENYWSDLKSEYAGIAAATRAIHLAEDVIMDGRPVRDPVAILYSVSQDSWYPDQPAAFVEKRLLWHCLRHLGVQPDFLCEEDVAAGRLRNYRLLYVADACVARRASEAIDRWTDAGGMAVLSAGACTRDEFNEPFVPAFARSLWPDDAAGSLQRDAEPHRFNERVDLPKAMPLTHVRGNVNGRPFHLPVLGCRLTLRPDPAAPLATFTDGTPAGRLARYGRGRVLGLGFLPMLAYGQGAGFRPRTLEETWPAEPRELVHKALDEAGVVPVARAAEPVVETGLLAGPKADALVLANYTYHPILSLAVEVKLDHPVRSAVSAEGVPVRMEPTPAGVRLSLPLEWTDLVLLERE